MSRRDGLTSAPSTMTPAASNGARALRAGVLTGPIFVALTVMAASGSPGFSLMKHQVSLLLIGPASTLQEVNFVLSGFLALRAAHGLLRESVGSRAMQWASALVGLFGLMLLVAAFAHPDPQLGFPLGAPSGIPAKPSTEANVHSLAFTVMALSIVVASILGARHFTREGHKRWARYCGANAAIIVASVAVGGGLNASGHGGLPLFITAICLTSWISAMCWFHLAVGAHPKGAHA